jgi:FdhE protein
LSLLELQTALCGALDADALLPAVQRAGDEAVPMLRLERLPLDAVSDGFLEFCRAMPELAPSLVMEAARAASGAAAQVRLDLLRALLTGGDVGPTATALGCPPAPLVFLARGYLSPVAEQLAAVGPALSPEDRQPMCPRCGWPPQVSKLQDEPGAEGNRRLVCAFCATDWMFPRSVCVACGVSGDDGLEFHVDEGLSHVRVESCRSCRSYLKSVDLRAVGLAEPLVDDLATPELDLWATDQGFEKTVPNLLGL